MTKTYFVLSFVLLTKYATGLNILTVFALPSKSHAILGNNLVNHLLNAGHDVTHITPMPVKDPKPKLHQIDVHEVLRLFPNSSINFEKFLLQKNRAGYNLFLPVCLEQAEFVMNHRNVQKLLRDKTKNFDLVIINWGFGELYSGIAAVLQSPYIWFSSTEPDWMVLELIDGIPNPAYTSSLGSITAPPFNFMERVTELFTIAKGLLIKNIYFGYFESRAYEKIFGPLMNLRGHKLPTYSEVKYNASLMLGNSYVTMGDAITLPQNYKHIGGYHIDKDVKPLTAELQKIMDNSTHGVIYFSMGSNIKGKDMPEELKLKFLKMFSKLKQTVLWKFEEMMEKVPSNVHILTWSPQQSILAHKNCKLFITHGGLLSLTEAVHFGVPIIGIPGFIDQFINVAKAVQKGVGVKVDLSYSMTEDLETAIEEVLTNLTYQQKAKELSLVLHDRQISPGAELIHWVHHVVKTNGAPLLRSPALMLPWYQKMYLDLVAVIFAIIICMFGLIKFLLTILKSTTNKTVDLWKKKL